MYLYEFTEEYSRPETVALAARPFVSLVFDDVLKSVENDTNYASKYSFDRHVFQKFIAVMFVNYATTDTMFYGTNRADYGVSADRDMGGTPLYRAVAAALRQLERGEPAELPLEGLAPVEALAGDEAPALFDTLPELGPLEPTLIPRTIELPAFGTEQMLNESFIGIADALRLLQHVDHPRINDCSRMISRAARQLFQRLQELGILSPMAANPVPPVGEEGPSEGR